MSGEIMNQEEVCKFLQINRNQLIYLKNTKKLIPCVKIFRKPKYKRSDVLEYLRKYVVMKDWEV